MQSAPAWKISCAVDSVMPKPPAAFSPLTMTKSRASSARTRGRCSATAARPDRPTTSPKNPSRMHTPCCGLHAPTPRRVYRRGRARPSVIGRLLGRQASIDLVDLSDGGDFPSPAEEGDTLVELLGCRLAIGEMAGYGRDRRGPDLQHQSIARRGGGSQDHRRVGLVGEADVD